VAKELIEIETRDGKCPTGVFRPDNAGSGPWPGVIVFMDGIGIRPALDPIAQRIADHGYFAILPDMFYRAGPYVAPEPAKLFADAELRTSWFKKIGAARDPNNLRCDIEAFLGFFDRQKDVKGPMIATTGYCMGGRISMLAAAWFPERIVAAGAFHPGGLATDDADSPHHLASQIKAKVYVAGASDDQTFDDAQRKRFDDALGAAGVDRTVLAYPAKHGWVPSDTPVHDPAQAERHFEALFALFDSTLKAG
jgi:carboxymethylenebutenolidase